MKVYIFSYTRNGAFLAAQLTTFFSEKNILCFAYAKEKYLLPCLESIDLLPDNFIQSAFKKNNAIIFISAIGIAIRKIAAFIKSKEADPSVIVIDETGKYVIPILSGHIGGANALARNLANFLAATAVITTATDLQNKFAVDIWAMQNNLAVINPNAIKYISSAVLDNIAIGFFDETNKFMPPIKINNQSSCGICISLNKYAKPFEQTLILAPRCIVIGMGCRRNADFVTAENLLLSALEELQISVKSAITLASIDLKKNESTLLELCEKYNLDFATYTTDELNSVFGEFTASPFVKSITGTDNICERAAVLASDNGELLLRKKSLSGVTIAIAKKILG